MFYCALQGGIQEFLLTQILVNGIFRPTNQLKGSAMNALEKFLQCPLPDVQCKDARQVFGMTQEEWAEFLDIPITNVRNWEQNRATPSRLIRILMSYLVQRKNQESKPV